ncbi:long-chain fatty acid--CoA ligase [Brevibacillus sp. AY1]|uniref:long-chain-fatty-acid--CoA ligase n=1 Tax=Brevibacillus sp. AY1 TaxID=2807621 RepID=UPI0024544395|nr:long-chain fatty acid--CoA ligase [Brevibacillus sp. AY1]MDH4617876.1 long-chain fatty acid--CoA ligase [Brevibacillus sp. AY1]
MSQLDMTQVTLPEVLESTCERYPERSAVYFKGMQMDYQTLTERVRRFAAGLRDLGIEKGDRVGIMLPNCPHFPIAYYGILQVGAIVVQINPMAVPAELEHFLGDSGAKAIVVFAPLLPVIDKVAQAASLKKIVVELPPSGVTYSGNNILFEALFASGESLPRVPLSTDDIAVLQYTGGTTGRSKGAMLTHGNLVCNAFQISQILKASKDGEAEDDQDRILTVIPLFHVYGMTVCMNMGIIDGSQLIMLPRFDRDEVLETIRDAKPTLFPGVPTMYVAVNAYPNAAEYGLSSIRFCLSGSAPLPVEIIKEFTAKTGSTIMEGYGLSEASPVTHFNPIDKQKPGSVGKAILHTESKIVDLQDGKSELAPGEVGELIIRGPQVMSGYWNMPEETENVIRDGWLYTGDIAYRDEEDYYYIVDRKKDMIIAGGYNIYPREVEEVLYQHPAVMEAVVIGVPDAYLGESVKAVVVLKANASLTAEELNAFCRENMAAYKVPRLIEFRDSLPKTAVGKILRRTLREQELAKTAAEQSE